MITTKGGRLFTVIFIIFRHANLKCFVFKLKECLLCPGKWNTTTRFLYIYEGTEFKKNLQCLYHDGSIRVFVMFPSPLLSFYWINKICWLKNHGNRSLARPRRLWEGNAPI